MAWLSWLLLAVALVLVRPPSTAVRRVAVLAARGPGGRRTIGVRGLMTGPARHRGPPGRVGRAWLRPGHLPQAGGLPAIGGSALVAGGGGWLIAGPAVAVATALVAGTAGHLAMESRRRRAAQRSERALLAAVRLLVADLLAGSRPDVALTGAADAAPAWAPALRAAAEAAARGEDAADQLGREPALRPLADAWRVADGCGAPIAEVLAGVATDLAAAAERRAAVGVALSGARSTAGLLGVLPVLGLLLGAAMGARPLRFLVQTGAGHLTCCMAAACDALGLLWTGHLLRSAER